MQNCAWHRCNRPFEPESHRQKFCSKECQRARGAWKERRGGPLVDMLLNNDSAALIAARDELQKEIKDEMRKA